MSRGIIHLNEKDRIVAMAASDFEVLRQAVGVPHPPDLRVVTAPMDLGVPGPIDASVKEVLVLHLNVSQQYRRTEPSSL